MLARTMFIFKISLDHGLIGYSFLLLLYSEARCGYNTKIPQITIISCYTIIRFFRVNVSNCSNFLSQWRFKYEKTIPIFRMWMISNLRLFISMCDLISLLFRLEEHISLSTLLLSSSYKKKCFLAQKWAWHHNMILKVEYLTNPELFQSGSERSDSKIAFIT